MRTTLDIADDVLLAAKEAARRQKTSVGALISELARKGLQAEATPARKRGTRAPSPLEAFGIRPLPKRGGIVTNELINRLRDDGPY